MKNYEEKTNKSNYQSQIEENKSKNINFKDNPIWK
jgi:hypothetical protein